MNILIIISFFFSFCTKALDTAQLYFVDQYFIFMFKMLKTKQNDKKKKKKKPVKKEIIVHLQHYALEIFKSHLHMQKINRF